MIKEVKQSRVSVAVQYVLFSTLNWNRHDETYGSASFYEEYQ